MVSGNFPSDLRWPEITTASAVAVAVAVAQLLHSRLPLQPPSADRLARFHALIPLFAGSAAQLRLPAPAMAASSSAFSDQRNKVVVKVGMIGDSQTGKTSLMVKYVEGRFDEDYIQTLGTINLSIGISIAPTTSATS